MRIISGNLKGRKIAQPNSKNTRPLKDLTKESIFNIMEHSNLLKFSFEKSTILTDFQYTMQKSTILKENQLF